MITNSTKRRFTTGRTTRDIVLIIVVFALLGLLIWKWFDYRIAQINRYAPPGIGLLIDTNHSLKQLSSL